MIRFLVESNALLAARMTYADEAVAAVLFDLPNNHGYIMRHSNQLSSLFEARIDTEAADE